MPVCFVSSECVPSSPGAAIQTGGVRDLAGFLPRRSLGEVSKSLSGASKIPQIRTAAALSQRASTQAL